MWLTWKYTLPAFLVPFVFVLAPEGVGLLLEGDVVTILVATLAGVGAVACLAVVTGRWLLGPAQWPERALFAVGALALLVMTPVGMGIGLAAIVAGVAVHLVRRRATRAREPAAMPPPPEPAA
jgi:TRAP-type uncharacterized transport system fused permease subunit